MKINNEILLKQYARSCSEPIGEYQFNRFNNNMKLIYLDTRLNKIKTLTTTSDVVQNKRLSFKEYEYPFLTEIQKIQYIEIFCRTENLSTVLYEKSSDKVKLAFIKVHRDLSKDKIKITPPKLLFVYIDQSIYLQHTSSVYDVLRNSTNPERILNHIYKQHQKVISEEIIHNNHLISIFREMLLNTEFPDRLILAMDRIIQLSWKDKKSLDYLKSEDAMDILTKNNNPEGFWNLFSETKQKEILDWYYQNYTYWRRVALISGSTNSTGLVNILKDDLVEDIEKYCNTTTGNFNISTIQLFFQSIYEGFKHGKLYNEFINDILKALSNSKHHLEVYNLLDTKFPEIFEALSKLSNSTKTASKLGEIGF